MPGVTSLPERIGRYRVERLLGRGAMGLVCRAHDPDIDRPVAIKLILTDLLAGADRDAYVARFRREAQAAGRCMHPNIVAVHDVAITRATRSSCWNTWRAPACGRRWARAGA